MDSNSNSNAYTTKESCIGGAFVLKLDDLYLHTSFTAKLLLACTNVSMTYETYELTDQTVKKYTRISSF